MSGTALFGLAQTLAVIALLYLLILAIWTHSRQQRAHKQRVQQRLQERPEGQAFTPNQQIARGPLTRWLNRANLQLNPTQLSLIAMIMVFAVTLVGISSNWTGAAALALLLIASTGLYWRMRYQQQRRIIHDALPGLMEAVLRYLDAGRTLDLALQEAFHDAPAVFKPLAFRLRSAVESGRDYTPLFDEFGELYRINAMNLIAIALRTATRFGASIRPVLQQVSESLRDQQALRREFLAATSETRFTAGAFTLLPLGVAAYMLIINDNYADILLHSDTGNQLLITAGVLQCIGVLIIWRMVQGVGRE